LTFAAVFVLKKQFNSSSVGLLFKPNDDVILKELEQNGLPTYLSTGCIKNDTFIRFIAFISISQNPVD
jgi:hypothetical protein